MEYLKSQNAIATDVNQPEPQGTWPEELFERQSRMTERTTSQSTVVLEAEMTLPNGFQVLPSNFLGCGRRPLSSRERLKDAAVSRRPRSFLRSSSYNALEQEAAFPKRPCAASNAAASRQRRKRRSSGNGWPLCRSIIRQPASPMFKLWSVIPIRKLLSLCSNLAAIN